MDNNYWIYEDYFIFKPEFNGLISHYIDIICNYKNLIFSNYDYYDYDIFIKINNKFENKYFINYRPSQFNQTLNNSFDNLPSITSINFW